MKTLITRTKTALIFVAVVLAGVWLHVWTFGLLMLAVMLLSFWEFFKLYAADLQNSKFAKYYVFFAMFIGMFGFVATFPETQHILGSNEYVLILLSPFLLIVAELFSHSERPLQNIGLTFLAVITIALPIWMLNTVLIKEDNYQPVIPMGILLLIWCNDAFAYLVGSAIGKHKIIPRISPGKTVEGTIGGIICNFITAYLLTILFGVFSLQHWMAIAVIVSVFATLGDWTESMMKRSLQVKDSGNLLPGHGGMLDRFDAFFFAVPFVVAYLWWCGVYS